MWLDRFAGHTTPASSPTPKNTSYSATPPRSSHLAPNPLPHRPGFSPRLSSLSVASNRSVESVLPSAEAARGSGLKNQLGGSHGGDVSDALQVLEEILGPSSRAGGHVSAGDSRAQLPRKPDHLERNIDFGGLSLEAFATEQQAEVSPIKIDGPFSAQSVDEYEKEKTKFQDLHQSILECDDVLKSVETYLTSFQTDLAAVSAEIEFLQNRSTALNTKLENRRVVERLLGPQVEGLSVSPAIVRVITEGNIDAAWLKALKELEKRSKAIEERSKAGTSLKAVDELEPLLADLINKAVERIRDYVVTQIKALRSPNVNAQILQQNALLRYKDLFTFLAKHQAQLAEEISQAYANTMRWYYLSHFSRYKSSLEKLKINVIDKTDVLAQDESSRRGTYLAGSRPVAATYDAFSLGRRIDLLRTPSTAALPSYLAEEDKSAHYLEVPFRAFNLALIDNASAEYAFLTGFFSRHSFHAVNRKFMEIFEPTFALGH
ncbi:Vacuolar protein sorting-associated protein 52, partial [Elasticomyces elasticus]